MIVFTFYSNILTMGTLIFGFHHFFKYINIEKKMYEKFSINMMRSLICGTIAHEAYKNYYYIWEDKCLENKIILNNFKEYHSMFLSYFIFDTILLLYQIYLKPYHYPNTYRAIYNYNLNMLHVQLFHILNFSSY